MTPKQLKGTILWLMMRSSDEELVDMLKHITLEKSDSGIKKPGIFGGC